MIGGRGHDFIVFFVGGVIRLVDNVLNVATVVVVAVVLIVREENGRRSGGGRLSLLGHNETTAGVDEPVDDLFLVETGLGHEETFVLRGGIRIVPVGNEPLFEDGDNLLGKVAASLFGIRGDDDGGMRAWHRALDGLRGEHRNERKVIRAGLPKVCPRGRDLGVLCEVVEGSRALAKVRDGG